MYRRSILTLCVPAVLLAVPAHAMALRILSPTPDEVVREKVAIKVPTAAIPGPPAVPAKGATEGQLIVDIDNRFAAAVARQDKATTVYIWDTKGETDPAGPVKDGRHEIEVSATDAFGEPYGNTDRVEVFVRNQLSNPPKKVRLRYHFQQDEVHDYAEKVRVRQAGVDIFTANVKIRSTVDDMEGSGAMIREKIERDSVENDQGQDAPFYLAGRSLNMTLFPTGAVKPGYKMRLDQAKAVQPLIAFPVAPVSVGSTWTSMLRLNPFYQQMDAVTIRAQNTLESFEWEQGFETAKIVSTFKGPALVSVAGVPTRFQLNGKRTTWFAFRVGKIIRTKDEFTSEPLDSSSLTGGTTSPTPVPSGYPPSSGYRPSGYPTSEGYPPSSGYRPNPYAAGGGASGSQDQSTVSITITTRLNS